MIRTITLSIFAGLALATAAPAPAFGDTTANDRDSSQTTRDQEGPMSPQLSPIEGTLNRLCLAIPVKANIQQLIGLINIIAVQDIPILSAPQNQQCTDNGSQAKGDEPLSHILDQVPVLSSNGVNNE